jgi:hypothetical protein
VQRVANDDELLNLAATTLDTGRLIHKAANSKERIARATDARSSIDSFITRAASNVHADLR